MPKPCRTALIVTASLVVLCACTAGGAGPLDSSSAASSSSSKTCSAFLAPDEQGTCNGCVDPSTCQSNGCFGGYYCQKTTGTCTDSVPASCRAKDAGADSARSELDSSVEKDARTAPDAADRDAAAQGPVILASFDTPTAAGLQPVIDAIDGAKSSIRMVMYHLTVQAVADALVAAAKRGVDVEIIIDQSNWASHTTAALKSDLSKGGVKVTPSSTGFRITHEKSFVVDETIAYIMSLNLTSPYVDTRDYAVVTDDKGVVQEFLSVFQADLANAKGGTATTPALSSPYLAWSPVNSEGRLTDLVNSATSTLVASSENIGDPSIQDAMIAAAGRGVRVRILAPECDQNVDPTYDLPFLATLAAGGVDARAMPGPPSPTLPYTHAKMMIADGARAFIGSVNFSTASTTDARELGIFFEDPASIAMVSSDFESDWALGIAPPSASSVTCAASTGQ